jgi:hypothetical protein
MAKSKKKSTTSKTKRVFKKVAPKKVDPWAEAADEGSESDDETWEMEELPPTEVSTKLQEQTKAEAFEVNVLKKYPSPKRNSTFLQHWKESLPDIAKRDNFKPGHLSQLELLCDLHVEYKKLCDFIDKNGYTYKTVGRHGLQHKAWPQVAQRNRCLSEIRMYQKALGLILVKDKEVNTDKGLQKEWD